MFNTNDLIGKYRVKRLLGQGGMGCVYLAHDEELERDLAVKVINPKLDGVENALRRFRQEAKAVAGLNCPNIVHVYEFNAQAEAPYLAMEYVKGQALNQIIQKQAPLDLDRILNYAAQILTGLQTAHEAHIIHRDIKPANILVSEKNVVKLTDFGLARSIGAESGLTASGVVVGTLHYLAPEVARGDDATPLSDLYSVGATIYEMITGEAPFDDESPLRLIGKIAKETPAPVTAYRNDITPALAAWLNHLLASEPERRFASAAQAIDLLKQATVDGSNSALHAAPAVMVNSSCQTEDLPAPVPTPPPSHHDAETLDAIAPAKPDPSPQVDLPDSQPGDINPEEVDAIMAKAIEIEKAGRNLLHEESLMEIGAEVGVSPDAVRAAIEAQKVDAEKRKRTHLVVAVAVAALLLIVVGALYFKKPAKATRDYRTTAGTSGTMNANTPPMASTEGPGSRLVLTGDWVDTDLTVKKEELLIIRAAEGKAIQARIGNGPSFSVDGTAYCVAQESGELALNGEKDMTASAAVCTRLRLAALPFGGGSKGSELGDLASAIGDTVATRLAMTNCFEVVERIQVDKVIDNLKLEQSEYFDPATAGRIGQMLGTEHVINGTVQRIGKRYRLTARRVEAETGKALESVVLDGPESELFDLQDRLAAALESKIAQTEADRLLGKF
ncbi:MAG: protein kinase domain-containing protein [Planctomycetota bacterium]|jgi:serine/threonine protein kinase/TolB-like protein